MKALIVIVFLALISGCTGKSEKGELKEFEEYKTHCDEKSADDRAEFILQCLKNANPKSDEEPEDWIYQCQNMAEDTLCPSLTVIVTKKCKSTYDFSNKCRWYSATVVDIKVKTND